ncbi:MAG: phosphoribosyl-ATP diphosphatase [Gammaproteobacteria bacterium]|nr:phosphoribosyl-ATP diphosphatase [Gammaproteobacteria bacterium]
MSTTGLQYLLDLESVLEQRKGASTEQSYTAKLYRAGPSRIAQKVGEEAVELALASIAGDRGRILAESADLMYHLLVLLRSHDIRLAEVAQELSQRQREVPV